MKKERMKLWIKELRETKTTQFRGQYMSEYSDSCCALGLLMKYVWSEQRTSADVVIWLDLGSNTLIHKVIDKVIDMNDVKGKSFSEIADYLEGLLDG